MGVLLKQIPLLPSQAKNNGRVYIRIVTEVTHTFSLVKPGPNVSHTGQQIVSQ